LVCAAGKLRQDLDRHPINERLDELWQRYWQQWNQPVFAETARNWDQNLDPRGHFREDWMETLSSRAQTVYIRQFAYRILEGVHTLLDRRMRKAVQGAILIPILSDLRKLY
jgi:uridine kinase